MKLQNKKNNREIKNRYNDRISITCPNGICEFLIKSESVSYKKDKNPSENYLEVEIILNKAARIKDNKNSLLEHIAELEKIPLWKNKFKTFEKNTEKDFERHNRILQNFARNWEVVYYNMYPTIKEYLLKKRIL
jgi:hypothetical protein